MATSPHCSGTARQDLEYECKQNRDDNERDHPLGGLNKSLGRRRAGIQILAGGEIQAFTISDATRNKPEASTRAKERSRSFTTLKMLRTALEIVSSGTLQMVFTASLSSLTTAVAAKKTVTSARTEVAMPLKGRTQLY